jgi:hypothetical protein
VAIHYRLDDPVVIALDHVEIAETRLLGRGIVDAGFTLDELESVIDDHVEEPVDQIVDALLKSGLVLEHDGLYRSRMAETVRQMSALRQSFRLSKVSAGSPLVADYRLLHKPRLRPRTDTTIDALWSLLGSVSDLEKRTAQTVAPSKHLRAFQVRGAERILTAVRNAEERAVVVAAGTGSGKTSTFYIPALMAVAGWIADDQAHWTKVLALYPRNELLKDQFREVLRWAVALHAENATVRPMRLGAWFGGTPTYNGAVDRSWGRKVSLSKNREGYCFPLSGCLSGSCDGEFYWMVDDIRDGVEVLRCGTCKFATPPGMVGLTRESLRNEPADVLFSTTESLNRQISDSDSHAAFGLAGDHRLRIVLIDEIHTYEGLSGAQTAYLMRRLRHMAGRSLVWCGLSATLANGRSLASQFFGLGLGQVEVVEPSNDELEPVGAEYVMALRHDPSHYTSPLSVTIQVAVLMARCLDAPPDGFPPPTNSGGLFGQKSFVFTDKLDVTNRLFWAVMDAEGWKDQHKVMGGHFYPCRTLAHLRSAGQEKIDAKFRELPEVRDVDGQWWWIAEKLGHAIGTDRPKNVQLVSSQLVGTVNSADIVVATSTLEVGYSDDRVGAVLQHRAPRSAASYLQRKGRAGRRIEMRPWTVVTLSGWGRDRLAWQMYDQFLNPIVSERHLPLRNRYVQRIQVLGATFDWLSGRLAGVGRFVSGSVWTDLAGPADRLEVDKKGQPKPDRVTERRKRQAQAAQLLESVMERGPEFAAWESFVCAALKMSAAELEMLYESSPRPILLSALPTMHRRLSTDWAGDAIRPRDLKYRNPVPDFVPSSLFADLVSTDVAVSLPGAENDQGDEEVASEGLPIARVLREFLPGNITRHFGSEHSDRHWVELPLPDPLVDSSYEVDVDPHYAPRRIGVVQHPTLGELPLCIPTILKLKQAPDDLADSTSTRANWSVEFEPVGNGATLDLPKSLTESVLEGATYLVHGEGSAVRVRRYVADGDGRALNQGKKAEPANHVVTFVSGGDRVALGFEYECDGISFAVRTAPSGPMSAWERRDVAAHALAEDSTLPATVSVFDRDKMTNLLDAAVVWAAAVDGLDEAAIRSWDADELRARVKAAAPAIVEIDDGHESTPAVLDFLDGPGITSALRAALDILLGIEPDWFASWRQCRLAATLGAALIEVAMRLQPEIDEDDLTLDVATDGRSLWITEVAPGGNGHIEALVRALIEAGPGLAQMVRSQSLPGEFERLGSTMAEVVRHIAGGGQVRNTAESLLSAWTLGHAAVVDASDALVARLRANGTLIDAGALRSISSRLLSPSQSLDFVDFAHRLVEWSDDVAVRLGYFPEHQILVWAGVHALADEVPTRGKDAPFANPQRLLEQLSWPRGRAASVHDLVASSLYGSAPRADRTILATALGPDLDPITLEGNQSVQAVLATEGEAIVALPPGNREQIRALLLESQVMPIDFDGLFLYPKVTGFALRDGDAQIRLLVEEVEQ